MANPRSRKRVFAHRRGPDGSAFERCDYCGVSVAIALLDMHECKPIVLDRDESDLERPVKRSKGDASLTVKHCFEDQPRSAFCIFMEGFRKSYKEEEWMEADRVGFATWKSLSDQEKDPYVLRAKLVNLAYEAVVLQESVEAQKFKVDDEADSGTVENFYPHFEDWEDSE
ncbi:hypothetical protein Scep_005825 [Stephania cephalantha]|uniref:HMG box domain-containing protein n=1 Tax=Stephania cephalantha TaxID=152367 RepID=A0AAP0Q0J5_9MAGN